MNYFCWEMRHKTIKIPIMFGCGIPMLNGASQMKATEFQQNDGVNKRKGKTKTDMSQLTQTHTHMQMSGDICVVSIIGRDHISVYFISDNTQVLRSCQSNIGIARSYSARTWLIGGMVLVQFLMCYSAGQKAIKKQQTKCNISCGWANWTTDQCDMLMRIMESFSIWATILI